MTSPSKKRQPAARRPSSPLPLWQRIGVGVALPLIFLLIALYMRSGGSGISCLFHDLTGLYCPGCGSSRSLVALIHGQFGEAFRQNVLLYPLGVPALAVLLYEYVRVVFPRLKLRGVYLPQPVIVGCAVAVVLFAVLRNIPAFSFLAPY